MNKITIDTTNKMTRTCNGTKIYLNGELLDGVVSVTHSIEAGYAETVTITMLAKVEVVDAYR